jgi:hypothetical protein
MRRRTPQRAVAAASVAALLYAALVLAAGKSEYPALTRAGSSFLVQEVLPAAVAAWLSLAFLGSPGRPLAPRALAHAVNIAALGLAIARFQPGSPPANAMFVLVTMLLTVAGLAAEWARRREPMDREGRATRA